MSNETPSGPGNVLLAVDGRDSCEEEACMALSGVNDPADVDVIFVTFTKSADQRLEAWRDHADAPPANIGIVSVEMGATDGGRESERNGGPAVRRISDPSDLTGVGIAISEFLSAWADTGQQTVVCFDSVTALLQYVEANRVFQFLNEMTSKFEQAGAHAHFHLMPEAHEPQDLSVLTSLFGDRKTAASVVGAGAAAGATEGGEDADVEAQEPADSEGEAGFVFADDAAEDTSTTEADDAESVTEAEETEPAAEADPAEPTAEAGETDSQVESDAAEAASDADEGGEHTTETTADTSDPETDADGDESSGGDQIDGDDGTATPADEPAGAPQDRVESSVQKVEDTDEQSTFGGKSSATARAANEGRDAASASSATTSTATASASTAGTDGGDDDENWYKNATFSRTTATVIGVVTMLVLISFLAAAMPLPVGDAPDDSGTAITTATPEPAVSTAATGATATETPTPEPTDTPTNTPTATPSPTPTPESSTSGSDGSSSTSSTDSSSTPTATATPAPTDTPTPTPEDDLGDTVDDTTDTVNDTLSGS